VSIDSETFEMINLSLDSWELLYLHTVLEASNTERVEHGDDLNLPVIQLTEKLRALMLVHVGFLIGFAEQMESSRA
jgi:hypothetical protein